LIGHDAKRPLTFAGGAIEVASGQFRSFLAISARPPACAGGEAWARPRIGRRGAAHRGVVFVRGGDHALSMFADRSIFPVTFPVLAH